MQKTVMHPLVLSGCGIIVAWRKDTKLLASCSPDMCRLCAVAPSCASAVACLVAHIGERDDDVCSLLGDSVCPRISCSAYGWERKRLAHLISWPL